MAKGQEKSNKIVFLLCVIKRPRATPQISEVALSIVVFKLPAFYFTRTLVFLSEPLESVSLFM